MDQTDEQPPILNSKLTRTKCFWEKHRAELRRTGHADTEEAKKATRQGNNLPSSDLRATARSEADSSLIGAGRNV